MTDGLSTFLACGLPLFESSGQCVETCPPMYIGTGNETTLTGTCEPCKFQLS